MLKKINKQTVFYVLTVVNLILAIIAIGATVVNAKWVHHSITKDTYNDIIVRTKIECLQNPSDECQMKLQRAEKNLEDLIREAHK